MSTTPQPIPDAPRTPRPDLIWPDPKTSGLVPWPGDTYNHDPRGADHG